MRVERITLKSVMVYYMWIALIALNALLCGYASYIWGHIALRHARIEGALVSGDVKAVGTLQR